MIREFESMDVRRLKLNQFSGLMDMSFVYEDDTFYKKTLVGEASKVHSIICFKRYWGNNFLAFFLISDEMPSIHARELKRFIYNAIIEMGADRVQTDSIACEELDRWHKFLGFTWEGYREKMIFDKNYNMWGLLKGRDF